MQDYPPSPDVDAPESPRLAPGRLDDEAPHLNAPQLTPLRLPPRPLLPEPPPRTSGLSKLAWLIALLVFLICTRYFVPRFAEELQYAITKGKQRAEYEVAGEHLKNLPLAELSRAYQLVSQRVGTSVVHINISGPTLATVLDGDLNGPHPRLDRHETTGQGSGVIVDSDGYIMTNRHVVQGSKDIHVKLSDGRTVPAAIVGWDELTDLAVLKIDIESPLNAADWGDSDELDVGALVWAVGSPFGLDRTITFGILSAKNRAGMAGTPYQDFLQTDAAVNPGNSGGPLVDAAGRVIGINTAIVGPAYQGISFAVPSNVARRVYQRIKEEGHVQRGWLGVRPDALTEELAKKVGLQELKGAYIVEVVEDVGGPSPAKAAGMRAGDVVVRWNDAEIDSPTDLFSQVARTDVGSTAKVLVLRDGARVTLDVRVGRRPQPLN